MHGADWNKIVIKIVVIRVLDFTHREDVNLGRFTICLCSEKILPRKYG